MNNQSNIFEFFDHKKYLNSRGIKTKSSGENVGKNWIGIEVCSYCGKKGYHFGMNVYSKHVNCWVCGTSKSIIAYVMKIDRCSYEEAMSTVIKFSNGDIKISTYNRKNSHKIILPNGIDTKFRKNFLNYIGNRGFSNPEQIVSRYQLMCTETTSEIPSRILFPYFLHGDMVTFIHRKIHTKEYINWPIEKSILDVKSTLYNIDTVGIGDDIVIVEGVFDVLKGGDKFCATAGDEWTFDQVQMIINKKPKRIFIIYDPENNAQKMAKNLASTLSLFCNYVENIYLTRNEDVGSMSENEIIELRKELGVN